MTTAVDAIDAPEIRPLAEVAAAVGDITAQARNASDLMQRLAQLVTNSVAHATTAVITLAESGRIVAAVAANEQGAWVADYQLSSESSIAHSVVTAGQPIYTADWTLESGWGALRDAVLTHGMRSSSCRPLVVDGYTIGALCVLSAQPDQFPVDARRRVDEFGALIATAIVGTRRNFQDVSEVDNLRKALTSRSTIDQAVGIIVAVERCSAEDAFSTLTRASQNGNVRLRDIAAELIRTYSNPAAVSAPVGGRTNAPRRR